ncbi:unnamed protein product [Cochlearia groenlandica]
MSRKPCCVREGLKKGAWTIEEDKKLISYIHEHGEGGWRDIPQKAGLKRCGKSCRLRWSNYLKPEIKRGEFSSEEEQIIMLHASRGNKWSVIARHLPRRTNNEIKNYWNTHLKKRLTEQGIDPVTHKPLDSSPNITAPPPENSQHIDAPSSNKRYSRSNSMPSLSPPSSEIDHCNDDDETLGHGGSLICKKRFKKSNSTSRLLNKVAAKATSIKDILSASIEGNLMSDTTTILSHESFFNGFSKEINNEEDGFLTNINTIAEFDQITKSSLHLEHEINAISQLGIDRDYNFSHFLENMDHVEYGHHDLVMSNISQEVSSTSVDGQDNMFENLEGWSKYLIDHADLDSF